MGEEKVPNQYRSALVAGRSSADGRAERIREALNAATLALQGGAWESPTAREFGRTLAGHRRTLQSAATDERDIIDAEVAKQPEEVEEGTWRANFAKLRHNI